jgi:hypothetical protein
LRRAAEKEILARVPLARHTLAAYGRTRRRIGAQRRGGAEKRRTEILGAGRFAARGQLTLHAVNKLLYAVVREHPPAP